MSMADIKSLDIKSIVSDNAIMFMWCTFPYLKDQLEVFEAWGFTYKTVGFTWIKTNIRNPKPFFGTGFYTKSNAEVCMLGTRGRVIKPATNKISSVVIAPRQRHSSKPVIIRDLINKLYPDLNKVELFAREYSDGWTSTGLDLDGKDIRDFINEQSL